jgi:hypothetical protein
LISLVVAIGLVVLGIIWLVFPFIVISHFNELTRLQRHANQLLNFIAERQKEIADSATKRPPPLPPAPPKVRYD